jgi:hypothetical protein
VSTGTGPEADRRLGSAPVPEVRFSSGAAGAGGVPMAPLDAQDPFPIGDFEEPAVGAVAPLGGVVHEREIRPRRRLRWWQTLPIALTGTLGSLMFAFPLAFESGDGGAVVGMLGLLLTAASAGWAALVARRVGYAWPGLPRRGSGRRVGWRVLAAYTLTRSAPPGRDTAQARAPSAHGS